MRLRPPTTNARQFAAVIDRRSERLLWVESPDATPGATIGGMHHSAGRVTLVGAGPGDPGLLTVAGARALAAADVVLYDALVSPRILEHCRSDAELVPVGKRAGAHSASQDEINALLVEHGASGKNVVRLKGGDPFVFGRGGEEVMALVEAGLPFEVIPGVTSAVAAPAYAGVPVTHRGMATNFAVVTGTEGGERREADWAALARMDTLVILMGGSKLGDIAERLMSHGLAPETPAAAISNGTLPAQRVVTGTLSTIADASRDLPTPIITVVGRTASLAAKLGGSAQRPLSGRTVVVTRSRAQSSGLASRLAELGADVIEAPVIAIRPHLENILADERVESRWDWVVFTSQNAVDVFFTALWQAGRDARSLGTTKLAAVGGSTSGALRARGLIADFVPSKATGERLAAELPRVSGARVYLPVSSLADSRLADGLRARGAHIERVDAYDTIPLPLGEESIAGGEAMAGRVAAADAITFTSSSTAAFLKKALGEMALSPTTRLLSIGPQTSAAVLDAFGRVDGQAAEPNLDSLVHAVLEALE